jgi:hypothetical protein
MAGSVQFLIAAAGIVALLLFWRLVVTIIGFLIAWSLRVLPLVGRRGLQQGTRSARQPVPRQTLK